MSHQETGFTLEDPICHTAGCRFSVEGEHRVSSEMGQRFAGDELTSPLQQYCRKPNLAEIEAILKEPSKGKRHTARHWGMELNQSQYSIAGFLSSRETVKSQ